jgi:hypothetical protein
MMPRLRTDVVMAGYKPTLKTPQESFSFMERFVNTLPQTSLSKMLSNALSGRKPSAILIISFINRMKEKRGLLLDKNASRIMQRNYWKVNYGNNELRH